MANAQVPTAPEKGFCPCPRPVVLLGAWWPKRRSLVEIGPLSLPIPPGAQPDGQFTLRHDGSFWGLAHTVVGVKGDKPSASR